MSTILNVNVELNGVMHKVSAKVWTVSGWTKGDVSYTETNGFDVIGIDGISALDFFMKNEKDYFAICKLARKQKWN